MSSVAKSAKKLTQAVAQTRRGRRERVTGMACWSLIWLTAVLPSDYIAHSPSPVSTRMYWI